MAHKAYIDVKLGDQDKCCWPSHNVCKDSVKALCGCTNGKLKLKFVVGMVYRELKITFDDFYFCLYDMTGLKKQ